MCRKEDKFQQVEIFSRLFLIPHMPLGSLNAAIFYIKM